MTISWKSWLWLSPEFLPTTSLNSTDKLPHSGGLFGGGSETPSPSCQWTCSSHVCRPEKHGVLTVFDLGNISHHNLSHGELNELAIPDNAEFLLELNAALQPPELLLLAPVIEGRH